MNKTIKNFNTFFENEDLAQNETYSELIVKSLARCVLEPITSDNIPSIVLYHLKDIPETNGLIKRLEYSNNVIIKEFTDFEFSKYDIEETGFIILSSKRYNCAFLFRKIKENEFKIYLRLNSKLTDKAYETVKSIFSINLDEEFYKYKPERRDNILLNRAVENLLKDFKEIIKENEYSLRLQENYKSVNVANTTFRNEIYQNIRQIAHEIKNQVSILDIYTRIFEKKTQDTAVVEPIKKSVALIKAQLEQFKNIDVINLQEKSIKNIISESIKIYSEILKEKNNKLILIDEIPEVEAKAFVDEEKFLIVLNNIIKNAHDSTANDEIIIRLTKEENKIKISFINHGEEIKEDDKSKIFEQGYTTKQDGWGVGLSVCKKYIGSQFGTFELTKSDKNETIFTVSIPLIET